MIRHCNLNHDRFLVSSTRVGFAVDYRCPFSMPEFGPGGLRVNLPRIAGYDAGTSRGGAPRRKD